ncbi:MAG: response regulator [Rhizobacter sp.]|nr:response regulator [Chlorobiales bacterium]
MPHTLLLVDDEPLVVQSVSLLFEKYNVLTASSGEEALAYFARGEKIDVVISDQRMPKMTGVELLREVRRRNPSTVRILMTGYSDLDAVIESVNTGEIFRYVNKPWQTDKLRETVALACHLSDKLKTAPPVTPSAAAFATGRDLLFVDTNRAHLEAFKGLLSGNYAVHLATSASEAFQILKSQPISVLVSEVNLPDADGLSFLASISLEYPHVVSILLSDSKDAGIAIRLINEVQVFRYLIKPFEREMLKSSIELAITQHHSFAAAPAANPKTYSNSAGNNSSSLEEALSRVRSTIDMRKTY